MRQSRRLWMNRLLILLITLVFSVLLFYRIEFPTDEENDECIRKSWDANPFGNLTIDFGTSYRIAFADVQRDYQWLYLPTTLQSHEILMMVISNCDNFARRNTLRRTWMSAEKNRIVADGRLKALFLVGIDARDQKVNEVIMQEARLYGDMIVVDMQDNYIELTYKTLTAFLYVVNKSPHTKLIGKIDEDVLFYPDQFFPLLENGDVQLNSTSLYGYYYTGNTMNHNAPQGRWYIPNDVTDCVYYPHYVAGPSYFATRHAAEKIIRATKHRKFISVEDGFITGILGGDAGVKKYNLPSVYAITDPKLEFLTWHTLKSNMEFEEIWEQYRVHRCQACRDHARNATVASA